MKFVKANSIRPLCAIALATILFSSCAHAAAKFDYKVISLHQANIQDGEQLEALLNKLGAEGWELIEIDLKGEAIFKRLH